MDRREFLKHMGGAAVATSVVLSACKNNNESSPIIAKNVIDGQGEMTYRVNHNTGDKAPRVWERTRIFAFLSLIIPPVGCSFTGDQKTLPSETIFPRTSWKSSAGLRLSSMQGR